MVNLYQQQRITIRTKLPLVDYLIRARYAIEGVIKIVKKQFNPYDIINNSENRIEDLNLVVEHIERDERRRKLNIAHQEIMKIRELEGAF